MKAVIALLPGDGIGPEVTREARRCLEAVAARFGHELDFRELPIGGAAIRATDDSLPLATLEGCRGADAVLLGAVGSPEWDRLEPEKRPEQGLLRLRQRLGLFANIRPTLVHGPLIARSPLRPELARGVDLVVVRELTGGIYYGERREGEGTAWDRAEYSAAEVERVTRVACRIARSRRGRLASVDKANVLATSRLWRRAVERVVRKEFGDLELEHVLVDAAALRLVTRPATFDVILTENLFGDILSDAAAALSGTLGMAPSASLGERRPGLFEPVHGSAPGIAGRGIANPCGAILSAGLLLRDGLGLAREAARLEAAVGRCLERGVLTPDLGGAGGTAEVGQAVAEALAEHARV